MMSASMWMACRMWALLCIPVKPTTAKSTAPQVDAHPDITFSRLKGPARLVVIRKFTSSSVVFHRQTLAQAGIKEFFRRLLMWACDAKGCQIYTGLKAAIMPVTRKNAMACSQGLYSV